MADTKIPSELKKAIDEVDSPLGRLLAKILIWGIIVVGSALGIVAHKISSDKDETIMHQRVRIEKLENDIKNNEQERREDLKAEIKRTEIQDSISFIIKKLER